MKDDGIELFEISWSIGIIADSIRLIYLLAELLQGQSDLSTTIDKDIFHGGSITISTKKLPFLFSPGWKQLPDGHCSTSQTSLPTLPTGRLLRYPGKVYGVVS